MGGRGRCLDNVFIERVCRSLKYEAVYLHDIADGFAAERVVGDWMRFCNGVRPHSSLNGRTPVEAYRFGVPLAKAAGPAPRFPPPSHRRFCSGGPRPWKTLEGTRQDGG